MWSRRVYRVSFQTLSKLKSRFFQYQSSRLVSSESPHLVMANVTRNNFDSTLEELRVHVRDADFISIDLEMTGITSAPWRDNFEFDTFNVRYSKLKDSAEKFAVVQFGVCPFRWDSAKGHFFAYPHNFYIFPRKELSVSMPPFDFLCQTASMEFLANHHFDFNTCIYEGISYLSKQQEAEARVHLGLADEDQSDLGNSGQNSKELKEIPLTSTADVLFIERIKIKFGQWRDTLLRNQNRAQHGKVFGSDDCNIQISESEIHFYKARPSLLLNGINSHQVKLVQQILRKHFKDLVFVEVNDRFTAMQKQVVYTHSEEDRELLMKELVEEQRLALETQLEQAIGFRHVIDLISSAGKVVVGHNCLLDFAHIHSKFIASLPPTVVEFAASLHKHFPYIVDTKHLLKSEPSLQCVMKNKSTALSMAFAHMCGQLPCTSKTLNVITNARVKVEVPTELQRYTVVDSGAKHEAGYDAFMTGCIFAQACHHLDIDFTEIHSPMELAKADKLQKYVNLLYLGWINGAVLDLTTGGDATESRPMVQVRKVPKFVSANLVIVWGFPIGYGANDLRGFVSGVVGTASSITGIFFLDESSAFVRFRNEQDAVDFLHSMEDRMTATSDSFSVQNPLATLLEAGCISAAGYDIYEQICKSSLSKLFFAEQAEALGIRWKIKVHLTENKKVDENVDFCTKNFESDYESNPMKGILHDHLPADRTRTLSDGERLKGSLSYLSEERFLDSVCASGPAFAKRSRT
eukprot:Gb_26782 [translate_table: standard]